MLDTVAPPTRSGRGLLWLGILATIAGLPLYMVQLLVWKQTFSPWYVPVLATIGAAVVLLSFRRRSTIVRGLVLAVIVFLAAADWWLVTRYVRLPEYTGPVASGAPFPEFSARRADGTPFTRADFSGARATALVFFRGHW